MGWGGLRADDRRESSFRRVPAENCRKNSLPHKENCATLQASASVISKAPFFAFPCIGYYFQIEARSTMMAGFIKIELWALCNQDQMLVHHHIFAILNQYCSKLVAHMSL